ncbi:MAG: hypothetical protein QOG89_1159 [Thermomicrobiales bacterium]|nr:hypothetical protein [Thermomicrobiales bacterium]
MDVVTASDAGLLGLADHQVLAKAHAASRVLVTRDSDYLRLHAMGQPHSGIIFWTRRARALGELIETLVLIYEGATPQEMMGHVEFV